MSADLLNLDPAKVKADDNSRYSLKKSRVDQLALSIMESGGVLQPVIVEPLSGDATFTHRLIAGFYRHAAVVSLNKDGAGLTLPAVVRQPADAMERLKNQLAENMERENQSPMDQAVAIQKLLDAGVSRIEIRRMFARPGGRKGNIIQPASNSWVNISLRLLEMPKAIQQKIHEGTVGFAAAYELGKVPPEKRQAVIERAEAERMRQIEAEEKDEEKYLNAEKKLTEAESEAKAVMSDVEKARAAAEAARLLSEEKQAALRVIQQTKFRELDAKARAGMLESLKAAEADVKGAQKAIKDAQNEVAKLLDKQNKATDVAKAQREKLEAARKAVKAAPKKTEKKVGPGDVKKAAKEEGIDTGAVPLNASEFKQVLKDLKKVKDVPKVHAIATAMEAAFAGILTPKQLAVELAVITGEKK